MVAPSSNPVACRAFEGEIVVLPISTVIKMNEAYTCKMALFMTSFGLSLFKIRIYQSKND